MSGHLFSYLDRDQREGLLFCLLAAPSFVPCFCLVAEAGLCHQGSDPLRVTCL